MRIASFQAAAAALSRGLRWFADDAGASLVEYCLIMAIVSVAAIAGLTLVGHNANTTLSSVAGSLSS
jgi:Flp pilus assembly pilin Flp